MTSEKELEEIILYNIIDNGIAETVRLLAADRSRTEAQENMRRFLASSYEILAERLSLEKLYQDQFGNQSNAASFEKVVLTERPADLPTFVEQIKAGWPKTDQYWAWLIAKTIF